MKSYTDLEQSKKLAEILPFESADMYYPWYIEEDGDTIKSGHRISIPSVGKFIHKVNKMILPCWSLAALLSVLDFPSLTQNKEDEWEVCVLNHKSDGYINVLADNPIDACYEMILKLNELKMLYYGLREEIQRGS